MQLGSKLNAWSNSRRVGERVEHAVCSALNSIGHDFAKNNGERKKEIDLASKLRSDSMVEVKCAFTPYPSEKTPAGLSNKEHLTLDLANIEKYQDDVFIVFAVQYPDTQGIYVIKAGDCKRIVAKNPKRVYMRSRRTDRDKAKKVGIAISECFEIKVRAKYLKEIAEIAGSTKK